MAAGNLPEGIKSSASSKKTVNYRGKPDLTPNLDCSIFVDIRPIQ